MNLKHNWLGEFYKNVIAIGTRAIEQLFELYDQCNIKHRLILEVKTKNYQFHTVSTSLLRPTHPIVISKTMNCFTLKTSRKIIETLKIKLIDNRFYCLESVALSTGCFNSALRNKMQIDDLFQYFNNELAYSGYKSNEMVY